MANTRLKPNNITPFGGILTTLELAYGVVQCTFEGSKEMAIWVAEERADDVAKFLPADEVVTRWWSGAWADFISLVFLKEINANALQNTLESPIETRDVLEKSICRQLPSVAVRMGIGTALNCVHIREVTDSEQIKDICNKNGWFYPDEEDGLHIATYITPKNLLYQVAHKRSRTLGKLDLDKWKITTDIEAASAAIPVNQNEYEFLQELKPYRIFPVVLTMGAFLDQSNNIWLTRGGNEIYHYDTATGKIGRVATFYKEAVESGSLFPLNEKARTFGTAPVQEAEPIQTVFDLDESAPNPASEVTEPSEPLSTLMAILTRLSAYSTAACDPRLETIVQELYQNLTSQSFLLVMEGCVEPTLHGPFQNALARDIASLEYRDEENCMAKIDLYFGKVKMVETDSYTDNELDELAAKYENLLDYDDAKERMDDEKNGL